MILEEYEGALFIEFLTTLNFDYFVPCTVPPPLRFLTKLMYFRCDIYVDHETDHTVFVETATCEKMIEGKGIWPNVFVGPHDFPTCKHNT